MTESRFAAPGVASNWAVKVPDCELKGAFVQAAPESVQLGGAALLTVNVRVAVPVPPELVALRVTLEVPAVVGVPEIRPSDVLTERPLGSPVALKLVGLLVAVC